MSEGCYDGEYSKLNVTAGNTYSFRSSLSTDYITISNEEGTTAFVFGTGTVVLNATRTAVVRFYTHNVKECGSDERTKRSRQVSCVTPTSSRTGGLILYQITTYSGDYIPAIPVVSAITNITATISWPVVAGSDKSYEFEIRTSGTPDSTLQGLVRKWATTTGVTSSNITGLNPSTGYAVYVRVKCGNGPYAAYSPYRYSVFYTTSY